MQKQVCIAIVLFCVFLTSSAEAVTVTRKRLVTEETTIKKLFVSVVRGLGFKLAEELEDTNVEGLKGAAESLNIELETMEFTLSEGSEKKARVAILLPEFEVKVLSVEPDFDAEKIDFISQKSKFWATVDCHRIHFRQELEYAKAGFVRVDIKVLNSVERVNRLDFYFDLFEKVTDKETRIETSLTIGARVPGRDGGVIHRYAARQISERSDASLVKLDRKVREIVGTEGANFLELVPLIARRAIRGAE